MSLEDAVREVQRKIGRNILLFQQLEFLLKYIIINGQFSGCSSDIDSYIATKKEAVGKQTMGQLVKQFVERNDPRRHDCSDEPESLDKPSLSLEFRMDIDEKSHRDRKESLSRLVFERNQLVHHLLPGFDASSIESCKEIETVLDKQSDRVKAEINYIQSVAKALLDMRRELSEFLRSDDGRKELWLCFLRQDPLVILLAEIATKVVREDGWTLMSTAGNLVQQFAPDELELLHKGIEHKSLKSLMLKTEIFDFNEEATEKGGVRLLYKLKDGFHLQYT